MFLNNILPCEKYRSVATDLYFVDKTALLEELIPALGREKRFFCITRPRRFGKTVMANMVAAFFGSAADSRDVFDRLAIAKSRYYEEHINQHQVIYLDFSEMPEHCNTYSCYIERILQGLKEDLMAAYSELELNSKMAVWDMMTEIFQRTRQKFIFVLDEWDALFHMSFITQDDQKQYLLFLKSLLKSKIYVELAYMTGILPIVKYSGGSELNMFAEYNMATREKFSGYFGFSDEEVDQLFQIYLDTEKNPRISREELAFWYDGYHTAGGKRLYNPRSVIYALTDNQLGNYWTGSGPYDEIFFYIKDHMEEVRDDLALMVSGERVEARLQEYAVTAGEWTTRDQIYSAMVVYGLLTYEDGNVFIPNREMMDQYDELLLSNERMGYVNRLARESRRMLKATLAGDTQTMAEILKYAHDTESPILSYNSEIELSAVVNLVYLAARDRYRVEREDKAGEGYVDFIFYPVCKKDDAIILELKIDSSPEEAIRQIKDKNYLLRFRGKLGEAPKYKGRILLAGISYSRKTKEHNCKVEAVHIT